MPLTINIAGGELWDQANDTFVVLKPMTITMEHSLLSISKWESKYHKAFLTKAVKSPEEFLYYCKCMTISPSVPDIVYRTLSTENQKKILDYIEDSHTATWFREEKEKPSRETVTSELVYYWMVAFNIPFECQKWHLNRLLTLIRICSKKNAPPKKMSKRELMERNKALNAARRAKYHTKG